MPLKFNPFFHIETRYQHNAKRNGNSTMPEYSKRYKQWIQKRRAKHEPSDVPWKNDSKALERNTMMQLDLG